MKADMKPVHEWQFLKRKGIIVWENGKEKMNNEEKKENSMKDEMHIKNEKRAEMKEDGNIKWTWNNKRKVNLGG